MIITLGEGIIGTVASINAVVHGDGGWTVEAGVVAFAGIGLIFATWWTYFLTPWARVLSVHRERSFRWSYGHIVAYYLEHQTTLGPVGTVLSTAIPFAIYTAALYALYAAFTRHADPFQVALLAGTTAVLVLSVALAALGVGVAACLLVLMFAPVVTVVVYETVGHRHVAAMLDQLR